jgi:hypothetical protein
MSRPTAVPLPWALPHGGAGTDVSTPYRTHTVVRGHAIASRHLLKAATIHPWGECLCRNPLRLWPEMHLFTLAIQLSHCKEKTHSSREKPMNQKGSSETVSREQQLKTVPFRLAVFSLEKTVPAAEAHSLSHAWGRKIPTE